MSDLVLRLVRHGETDWNAQGRVQGHIDVPLNERGLEQAHAVADLLAGCGAELVLSSDLRRAADTATVIGERLDVPVEVTERLRERNLGSLQGKTAADLGGETSGFVSRTVNDPWSNPEGGERLDEFRARVRGWAEDLRAERPAADIIAVTHGGAMRAALIALLGTDRREGLPRIGNCAVITLRLPPTGDAEVLEIVSPATDDAHAVDEIAGG